MEDMEKKKNIFEKIFFGERCGLLIIVFVVLFFVFFFVIKFFPNKNEIQQSQKEVDVYTLSSDVEKFSESLGNKDERRIELEKLASGVEKISDDVDISESEKEKNLKTLEQQVLEFSNSIKSNN